ncbi:YtzH-like family protein [Oceanobacillus jeddahense]|uniref:YtzH-like family protein n=1 Tax=Oceanobacillus jeddahense TaxID=1462527 RepID=A0ABY5JNJ3_9BACI|nr:YtzH-like family protein [Oceanobacillus jeddahense]UUI01881.1 YtzH-like family protein [Oceanobacillus jeddahense]
MQLSIQNKLQLLCDILDEHQTDSSVSPNEHAQLERLAASILAQKELSDQDIQNVLTSIHLYGKEGAASSDLAKHINNHQDQFRDWIDTVQQNL